MTPSDMPPDNPQTPAYKAAKLAVIILSALIVLAVIALIVGGIAKVSGKPKVGTPSTFTLAPGAKILAMESQPGRLILRIRTETGEEIDILDTDDGHLVGQVKANFSK
jgi:Flp pilus assembly protein CpaB